MIEKIKNRHEIRREFFFKKYDVLLPWLGINNIHFTAQNCYKKKHIQDYYSKVKGDIHAVHLHSPEQISYHDHLPRIRTQEAIETAIFTKPNISTDDPVVLSFNTLSENELIKIQRVVDQNPHFAKKPEPFRYSEMESGASLNRTVCVGLPDGYDDPFIFNQHRELTTNVLHLPIKITKEKSIELQKQGRILSYDSQTMDNHHLYIPRDLSYIAPLVNYICSLELMFNPFFVDDYYIFVTVSDSIVQTNTMQRRGGWHIDGHQGHERTQRNGDKLFCDRQYLLCNALPTETVQHQFDFSEVRAYCKKQFCHMDSVNMQDVIEHEISKILPHRSIVSMETNQLFFLNPYIIHKAKVNVGPPLHRTFLRILVSTFKRDRLGDTVNPLLGPLWRYKIKTITDIHEMERRIL